MTTTRRFVCDDLFHFNNINLDPLTETYNLSFYLQYLSRWPEYCEIAESPTGRLMGYILGKDEGSGKEYHGHVTALTVSPEFRRLKLADKFMSTLEQISEFKNCYFVDLFVRKSNEVAIDMYKKFGYVIYRRVIGYYSGVEEEDAYDMRKALSRDKGKLSMVPLNHPVYPEDVSA